MNKDVMFSSGDTTGTDKWETPATPWMADLVKRFRKFTLDPAASAKNAKAPRFYTEKDNGLEKPWDAANVFVNPPYGRSLRFWVEKAVEEIHNAHAKQIVMLLPGRTDVRWFHRLVIPYARECFFVPGRITFHLNGKPVKTLDKKRGVMVETPAPFPSIIVRFDRDPMWWGHCTFAPWPRAAAMEKAA